MPQVAPEDREVSTITAALGGDLLVGHHGAQPRAPVHRRLGQVHQPLRVDDLTLLVGGQVSPEPAIRGGPGALRVLGLQLGDRAGPPRCGVVPRVVDLQEDPLRPAVVLDVSGGDPAALIVTQTQPADLRQEALDIRLGGGPRMGTGLRRIQLGRQPEGVEAHGVQHVAPGHPLVAGEDIGADVAQRVPDVQATAGRVGEHVLHEQLVLGHNALDGRQRPDRVGCVEGAAFGPLVLPAALDLTRQRRGVPVQRDFGGDTALVGAAHVVLPGRPRQGTARWWHPASPTSS